MVATNRTHVSVFNIAVAGASAAEQFQNIGLALHIELKAAGFVVQASSDSVTADATDRISVIADIVSNSAGNAHTWIHYLAPTVMGSWELVLDFVDTASPPRKISWFGAPSYNSDGAITTRPTVAVGSEWSQVNTDFMPSGAFQAMSIHRTRASDGEVVFGVSINGTNVCETGLWIAAPKGGDDPGDIYPYAFFLANSGSGAFTQVYTASQWHTHGVDNSSSPSVEAESIASVMNLWVDGESQASGNPFVCPLDFIVGPAANGRYVGRSEDHRMAPALISQAELEDGDTDTFRRVVWDNVWFVVQASALPITF